MRAVVVVSPGGPEVLRPADVPAPSPGSGEVLVNVAAAGVNHADLLQRAGRYPPPPGAPAWPGLEVSGVVVSVGPDVPRPEHGGWVVGQEVAALLAGGGYAEQVAVPVGQLFPVPASVGLVDAAALPEAACTAWSALVDSGGLRAGWSVLVRGGSGGVGSVAVQIAAALGARVLATAGSPERARRCEELGAERAFDHHADDVGDRVLEATDGRGVDLVLDVLGAGGLRANLGVLATGGRLVVIGLQQGAVAELDLGLLLARRLTVVGTMLRNRPLLEKAALVTAVRAQVWPMLADGRLRPVVHARLPLDRAADAHRLLESGTVFGKVLLVP